jgi:hypothetical protein
MAADGAPAAAPRQPREPVDAQHLPLVGVVSQLHEVEGHAVVLGHPFLPTGHGDRLLNRHVSRQLEEVLLVGRVDQNAARPHGGERHVGLLPVGTAGARDQGLRAAVADHEGPCHLLSGVYGEEAVDPAVGAHVDPRVSVAQARTGPELGVAHLVAWHSVFAVNGRNDLGHFAPPWSFDILGQPDAPARTPHP